MLRQFALLAALLAVPLPASHQVEARATKVAYSQSTSPDGLTVSLALPNLVYPVNALVRATVTVRNVSPRTVTLVLPRTAGIEVDSFSGKRLYPPAFAAMPTTLHADFGPTYLRPGVTIVQYAWVVVRGPVVHPVLGAFVGRPVVLHLRPSGATPQVTVTGPPSLHLQVSSAQSSAGPLLYTQWATCSTRSGQSVSFNTANTDFAYPAWHVAVHNMVWPPWHRTCARIVTWHVLAGREGEPVASTDWPPRVAAHHGVLLRPRSGPAIPGVAYQFVLYTHCGAGYDVDFDGSLWDLASTNSTHERNLGNPFQHGTMTLVDGNHAEFTWDGDTITFIRHPGARTVPGLCA